MTFATLTRLAFAPRSPPGAFYRSRRAKVSGPMALRDIFKFRDPPETETSKPFLEHLEDLRWTIVKMALTLGVAMIVSFAFRSTLVRIIQAPLSNVGSQVGTLKALG